MVNNEEREPWKHFRDSWHFLRILFKARSKFSLGLGTEAVESFVDDDIKKKKIEFKTYLNRGNESRLKCNNN